MKRKTLFGVVVAGLGLVAVAYSQGGLSRTGQGAIRLKTFERSAQLIDVKDRLLRVDSKTGKAEVLKIKANLEGANYVWEKIPEAGVLPTESNYQFLLKEKGLASGREELWRLNTVTGQTWRTPVEPKRDLSWESVKG
jgi:hypothetical protein